MTRITTRLTAAATAALTGLVLTACTADDGGPIAAPTSATPPTPSPSPEPTEILVAPARPAAMDDDGPVGAEAAVKYFFSLDSYMQSTGDTSAWDAMSSDECGHCAARSEQARELDDAGLAWSGGDLQVTIQHTYGQDTATGIWGVDVTVHQAEVEVTDTSGAVIKSAPPSQANKRVELVSTAGKWFVVGVGNIPE